MKINNPFFKKRKYVLLNNIFNILGKKQVNNDIKINNITDLMFNLK